MENPRKSQFFLPKNASKKPTSELPKPPQVVSRQRWLAARSSEKRQRESVAWSVSKKMTEGKAVKPLLGLLPGHPKVPCFLEVFGYLKATKKHSFGCLGRSYISLILSFIFGLKIV